jgi:hypothetical protein
VDSVTFYRRFAILPMILPLLILAISRALPDSGPIRDSASLLGISVVGIPIYYPFARLLRHLLRNRPVKSYRNWSLWVPVAFALVVFAVWFIFAILKFPPQAAASKSLGAAFYAVCLGYAYVALMHIAFFVGRLLGLIHPPESAA